MTKQTLIRLFISRTGQIAWSGAFAVFAGVNAALASSPPWALINAALAGFLLCNLVNAVVQEWLVRGFRSEMAELRRDTERQLQEMVEQVKADLQRWANQHGFELEVNLGRGEPPPRWRQ